MLRWWSGGDGGNTGCGGSGGGGGVLINVVVVVATFNDTRSPVGVLQVTGDASLCTVGDMTELENRR